MCPRSIHVLVPLICSQPSPLSLNFMAGLWCVIRKSVGTSPARVIRGDYGESWCLDTPSLTHNCNQCINYTYRYIYIHLVYYTYGVNDESIKGWEQYPEIDCREERGRLNSVYLVLCFMYSESELGIG